MNNDDGSRRDLTIELLEVSSKMIEIFEDPKPVQTISDNILYQRDKCFNWFQQWETSVTSTQNTISVKNKMMLSDKLQFDLASMLVGCRQLSQIILNSFPGTNKQEQTVTSLEMFSVSREAGMVKMAIPTITSTALL